MEWGPFTHGGGGALMVQYYMGLWSQPKAKKDSFFFAICWLEAHTLGANPSTSLCSLKKHTNNHLSNQTIPSLINFYGFPVVFLLHILLLFSMFSDPHQRSLSVLFHFSYIYIYIKEGKGMRMSSNFQDCNPLCPFLIFMLALIFQEQKIPPFPLKGK